MIRALSTFSLTVGLLAAGAASALTLRPDVTAAGDVVRLGDFFTGGGDQADAALFHAPAPGTSGIVSIARLSDAVHRLGISWAPPRGVDHVTVERGHAAAPRTVSLAIVEEHLRGALAETLPGSHAHEDIAIALDRAARPVAFAGADDPSIDVVQIDIDPRRQTFEATLEIAGADRSERAEFVGSYQRYVDVPVLAMDLDRGQIIGPQHLTMVRSSSPDAARFSGMAEIVGMAARRRLRAGTTPGANDIESPKVVHRNDLVTITFQMPGLMLSAQGRTLDDGAVGDTVSVRNVSSNRVIQAVAVSEGRVSVAAPPPTHFAMR